MKKLLLLAVACFLLSAIMAGEGQAADKVEIALVPPAMVSPFYQAVIKGANEVAAKYGYELQILAPDREDDAAGLLNIVETMISKKVNAIALCAMDEETSVTAVKKANAAGIPIVLFNTLVDLPSGDVFAYVGYDQRKGGAQVAEYVLSKIQGDIKAAIIEGLPSSYTTERAGGFNDVAAKEPRLKVVVSQAADWEREKAMNVVTNILSAHPEINVIFGLSDEMGIGAGQAVKAAGKTINDILIMGLDGNESAFDAIRKGLTTGTCDVNPVGIGTATIETIHKALIGESSPKKVVTDTIIVDASNVAK
ncbi:predicted ABC-Type sugar transporter, periplasmic component [Candidatus Moduliflexus flocculans]|uniref:Predicted ABC-Type sugar transporter, periplasmic component n=1 Tax=Candidatus Moduliflexus flocculans TaxID=1499966 RepID=A0A081BPR5_9BACT|nr:predicted ABC-Type sugar transporter, periplasmic component [Candidatus Moduliflexus flocculans]